MRNALGLLLVFAACGDNLRADYIIETTLPAETFVAGERIAARCDVLTYYGEPKLDEHGNPLADSVELVVDYRHPDSFATDADGAVVAARAGSASVRCRAPGLELVDLTPVEIEIVPGPPVRVVTQLASDTTSAGEPVGVGCLAFDAYANPVTGFQYSLALSPFGAGTMVAADSVTANIVGEYEVSCVVMAAAMVEPDYLVVLPALPASLVASLSPERTVYTVNDQVTMVVAAYDMFGNRVDDVSYAYTSSPLVPSPSEARYQFAQDGSYTLTATVTSQTHLDIPLSVALPVIVNSVGPSIQCMRIDAPSQASEAYMIQRGPSTVVLPVRVTDAFNVQSVKVNGATATFNPGTGNYEAPISAGFGMLFADVVATDQFGKENSTTCFVLVAEFFTGESTHMNGALGLRLDPNAISDPSPGGLNSLNDIFYVILGSPQLRTLVNGGLVAANPIYNGSCGVFACNPRVTYNNNTIQWNQPSSQLSLINGGLRATVTFPNVRLTVSACGTTCCIGGSTITVTASSITATVDFSLALQGGLLRAAVSGTPQVSVQGVNLNGSGFCGFLINLVQGFFTGTVANAVRDALTSFINSDVGPMLDQLVSSLDINTLGQSFQVPQLDGSGTITLNFGLAFSSFSATTVRALLGIGTRFTPATIGHNRPSLGIPRRTPTPLLDPPGTSAARPVGISFYEGVLNQVLHGLWRGGYFQSSLAIAGGTATIDARLPPVAMIGPTQAQLMLGGISATITIPGVINQPLPIVFGGRATTSVSLVGDTLRFGNLTLTQLYVSFQTSLTQNQRNALENFLTQVLQSVLADAINHGLPAFPIPAFALPASAAIYGLPAGAQLGIVNPSMSPSGSHYVLTGSFGVRP